MKRQYYVRPSYTNYENLKKKCKDLEQDLSNANRENKDHRRELDTLRGKTIELEDLNRVQQDLTATLEQEAQDTSRKIRQWQQLTEDLQGEKASVQEELQEAKRKVDGLEKERRKAEEDMKSLTAQTHEAKEAKAAADAVIVNLREENEKGSEKLRVCKDDLLASQPPEQTSDNEVASQLTDLFKQIEDWVSEEFNEPQTLENLSEALTERHAHSSLGCLCTYLEPEHERLAAKYVGCQRLILCYLILCHLERSILGETVYLFGLDDQRVALLEEVEQGMAAMRDAMTIKRWRLESLEALCNTTDFQRRQHAQAAEVSQSLYSALSSLLLRDWHNERSAQQQLHEQITIPAAQIAMRIRLSPATYSMSCERIPRSIVYEEDMQRYVVTDLTTGGTVTSDRIAKVGTNGRIGKVKLVPRPGLQRLDGDNGNTVLCKPELLVLLDTPLRRRR